MDRLHSLKGNLQSGFTVVHSVKGTRHSVYTVLHAVKGTLQSAFDKLKDFEGGWGTPTGCCTLLVSNFDIPLRARDDIVKMDGNFNVTSFAVEKRLTSFAVDKRFSLCSGRQDGAA